LVSLFITAWPDYAVDLFHSCVPKLFDGPQPRLLPWKWDEVEPMALEVGSELGPPATGKFWHTADRLGGVMGYFHPPDTSM